MTEVAISEVAITETGMVDTRAVPFYCPYCGEEDLRPSAQPPSAWRCADCQRVFDLCLVGLTAPTREVAR